MNALLIFNYSTTELIVLIALAALVLMMGVAIGLTFLKSGKKANEKGTKETIEGAVDYKSTKPAPEEKPAPAPAPKPKPAVKPAAAPKPEVKPAPAPKPSYAVAAGKKQVIIRRKVVDKPISKELRKKLAHVKIAVIRRGFVFHKDTVSEWLNKYYGGSVLRNTREGGLSALPDIYYLIAGGRRICFLYVYEGGNGVYFLLKTNRKVAEFVREKGGIFENSNFPRGNDWYRLNVKDYHSATVVFRILALCIAQLGGRSLRKVVEREGHTARWGAPKKPAAPVAPVVPAEIKEEKSAQEAPEEEPKKETVQKAPQEALEEKPVPEEEPAEEPEEEPAEEPEEEPEAEPEAEPAEESEEEPAEEPEEEPAEEPEEEPAEEPAEEPEEEIAATESVQESVIQPQVKRNFRQGKRAPGAKRAMVNIDTISRNFTAGETVTLERLKEKKIISESAISVKVLARGAINKALTVVANDFSSGAVEIIEKIGGKAIFC